MKQLSIILIIISTLASAITVNAAPVPRESAPCNATEHQILVAESFISGVIDEVKNGMGYADARAKSNRIFFNAWLNGQTSVTVTENLRLLQITQYSNTEICI